MKRDQSILNELNTRISALTGAAESGIASTLTQLTKVQEQIEQAMCSMNIKNKIESPVVVSKSNNVVVTESHVSQPTEPSKQSNLMADSQAINSKRDEDVVNNLPNEFAFLSKSAKKNKKRNKRRSGQINSVEE